MCILVTFLVLKGSNWSIDQQIKEYLRVMAQQLHEIF